MSFTVVIPARRASTRLPDKVLRPIAGRPMLAHVCDRARASAAQRVVVATDDAAVAQAAAAAGVDAAMTRADHTSGTDRIAQVAADRGWADDTIIVNLQADEPLMPPALIDQVAHTLAQSPAQLATACTPLTHIDELHSPDIVKVVQNTRGHALYFSRAPIPWHRAGAGARLTAQTRRHLGIYAYRVAALQRFAAAAPGALEQIESLEQLRALDLGMTIQMAEAVALPGPGVDTLADLQTVEGILRRQS